MTNDIEQYTLEHKARRIMEVLDMQRNNPGMSMTAAVQECGYDNRTIRRWMDNNILQQYLDVVSSSSGDLAQTKAVEAMPSVVEHMVLVATGRANGHPEKAAEFVLKIAQAGLKQSQRNQNNFVLYLPTMLREKMEQQIREEEQSPPPLSIIDVD